jgi:hypothetical protein
MREGRPTVGFASGVECGVIGLEPFQEPDNILAQELLREQEMLDEQTLVVSDGQDGASRGSGKLRSFLRAILRRQKG